MRASAAADSQGVARRATASSACEKTAGVAAVTEPSTTKAQPTTSTLRDRGVRPPSHCLARESRIVIPRLSRRRSHANATELWPGALAEPTRIAVVRPTLASPTSSYPSTAGEKTLFPSLRRRVHRLCSFPSGAGRSLRSLGYAPSARGAVAPSGPLCGPGANSHALPAPGILACLPDRRSGARDCAPRRMARRVARPRARSARSSGASARR